MILKHVIAVELAQPPREPKAEATVITAFPKNEIQILSAQCPIPDYLAFVSRWRQQPCPLVLGQKRSSCHRFLFAKFGRQTKRIAPPLEGSDGNLTALNIPSSTRPRNTSC